MMFPLSLSLSLMLDILQQYFLMYYSGFLAELWPSLDPYLFHFFVSLSFGLPSFAEACFDVLFSDACELCSYVSVLHPSFRMFE